MVTPVGLACRARHRGLSGSGAAPLLPSGGLPPCLLRFGISSPHRPATCLVGPRGGGCALAAQPGVKAQTLPRWLLPRAVPTFCLFDGISAPLIFILKNFKHSETLNSQSAVRVSPLGLRSSRAHSGGSGPAPVGRPGVLLAQLVDAGLSTVAVMTRALPAVAPS